MSYLGTYWRGQDQQSPWHLALLLSGWCITRWQGWAHLLELRIQQWYWWQCQYISYNPWLICRESHVSVHPHLLSPGSLGMLYQSLIYATPPVVYANIPGWPYVSWNSAISPHRRRTQLPARCMRNGGLDWWVNFGTPHCSCVSINPKWQKGKKSSMGYHYLWFGCYWDS